MLTAVAALPSRVWLSSASVVRSTEKGGLDVRLFSGRAGGAVQLVDLLVDEGALLPGGDPFVGVVEGPDGGGGVQDGDQPGAVGV